MVGDAHRYICQAYTVIYSKLDMDLLLGISFGPCHWRYVSRRSGGNEVAVHGSLQVVPDLDDDRVRLRKDVGDEDGAYSSLAVDELSHGQ